MVNLKRCTISICLLGLLLGGCSQTGLPQTISESLLVINKEGGISEYLVDDFDRDYYDISEVQNLAAQETARYNTGKQTGGVTPVKLEKVELVEGDGSKALIQYSYDSADTFREFNQNRNRKLLFFGTVAQAGGYLNDLDSKMRISGVKKKDSIDMSGVSAMKEKHVIITDVTAVIYCPYSVTYISEGLVMREDGGVDTSGAGDSTAVIIMKK